ncbi:MAG: S28 family serine protease [Bacteroidales bacterium]
MKTAALYSRGILLVLLVVISIFPSCKIEDDFDSLDLLEKLNRLDGVTASEITPPAGYARAFQLDVRQPVDHQHPGAGSFTQRVYLSHTGEEMPVVFAPNGYRASASGIQEIAKVLQTNCLHVTHRYFYDSRPDPLNWQYLTIAQAAADHHRIVQLLKRIYKGKWISSGASKSGLTALFHKRFYPADVDATIAYVAPFIFGPKDEKFPAYLASIGGGDCFSKLQQVQVYVLRHREEMLAYLEGVMSADQYSYSMDHELILELHIMDYPFTFWQYYDYDCAFIPDTVSITPQEIFNHYTGIVPLNSFSDENLDYYEPFVYQSVTELGAPGYQTDYLAPYLKKIDPNDAGNPNYQLLAPAGTGLTFNYSTIPEIYNWLKEQGDHIIYIYGKNDPWSAGAIELNEGADALFFMQEGANHRVKISDLDNPGLVYSKLEEWLGITITGKKSDLVNTSQIGFRLDVNSNQWIGDKRDK